MTPCDPCKGLEGGGRRMPPHDKLEKLGTVRLYGFGGMRADEQDYKCRTCGQRWMHESGNSGYGWRHQRD